MASNEDTVEDCPAKNTRKANKTNEIEGEDNFRQNINSISTPKKSKVVKTPSKSKIPKISPKTNSSKKALGKAAKETKDIRSFLNSPVQKGKLIDKSENPATLSSGQRANANTSLSASVNATRCGEKQDFEEYCAINVKGDLSNSFCSTKTKGSHSFYSANNTFGETQANCSASSTIEFETTINWENNCYKNNMSGSSDVYLKDKQTIENLKNPEMHEQQSKESTSKESSPIKEVINGIDCPQDKMTKNGNHVDIHPVPEGNVPPNSENGGGGENSGKGKEPSRPETPKQVGNEQVLEMFQQLMNNVNEMKTELKEIREEKKHQHHQHYKYANVTEAARTKHQ